MGGVNGESARVITVFAMMSKGMKSFCIRSKIEKKDINRSARPSNKRVFQDFKYLFQD